MKTNPLSSMFEVGYGTKLDLNKMQIAAIGDQSGVNFVSRTSEKNGVSAFVKQIDGLAPYEAGLITVSLGGSKLLSAFVQERPFYTAQNVAVLRPRFDLTFEQKVFICVAIRHNRFRYSAFGREANRTLKSLEVPTLAGIPTWLNMAAEASRDSVSNRIERVKDQDHATAAISNEKHGDLVEVSELFDVVYGSNLEMNKMKIVPSGINFVSRTFKNNGVSAIVERVLEEEPIKGPVLTVAGGGSVLETFLQLEPFYSGRDMYVLFPKASMSIEQMLYYCYCIRSNKYRFSYGRQANRTLKQIKIPAIHMIPKWVQGSLERAIAHCEQVVEASA